MTIQLRGRVPITIGAGAGALVLAVGAVLVAPAPAQADPISDLLCGLLCPAAAPTPAPSSTPTPSTTPSSTSGTPSASTPTPTPTSSPIVSSGPIVVDVPDVLVSVPPIVVPPIVIGGGTSTPTTTPTTGLPTSAPTTAPTTVPTSLPTSIPDVSTPPTGSTPTTGLPTTSTPTTPTTTAPVVAALRSVVASANFATVFPVKDGYRDSVSFEVKGTTSIGSAIPVTGKATLTRNGKTVTTWTLKSSTQRLVWNGRVGKAVKAGAYVLTVAMRDAAGDASTATTRVQVSGQRLVAAASKVKSAASTGTHAMALAPRKGLEKATVTLQVTTTATGMKGTQKLVFSKNGKKIVVPVRNGTHTSKPIVVPKALTSFKLTHTWKTGKLVSATYVYKYKVLK